MKKIVSPIMIISSPFAMLVYPKLIHYFETNQKDKFKNIIIKVSFYILVIGIMYSFIAYFLLGHIFEFMNVKFEYIYNIYYFLVAILAIINSQMWWVRIFSNTVNPNYSVYMNVFATISQLVITILITKYFGFIGMIISIIIINIMILRFWLRKGYKYVYTYIYSKYQKFINKIRIINLKLLGAEIGENIKSFGKFTVMNPQNLIIGDNSTLNQGVHMINCRDKVIIGKFVRISTNVQIHTGKLIINSFPRIHTKAPVIIENNVWIASGAVISARVRIGENSVVIRDVEPNSFYARNPAKKIKDLESNKKESSK